MLAETQTRQEQLNQQLGQQLGHSLTSSLTNRMDRVLRDEMKKTVPPSKRDERLPFLLEHFFFFHHFKLFILFMLYVLYLINPNCSFFFTSANENIEWWNTVPSMRYFCINVCKYSDVVVLLHGGEWHNIYSSFLVLFI